MTCMQGLKLRREVGQLMITGLESASLSATERAWLRMLAPSGVILFRRNIEAPEQAASLLREATEAAGAPLFRCVDLEGGLVDRLRDALAPMPSPAAVFASGRAADQSQHGRLIGRAARMLGFNITFAPVLDLALPISSKVMRTRVVSADPQQVTAYAARFLDGLAAEDILGCGKHFPGLGGGTLDSHAAMPAIERTKQEMWEQDLTPFRALAARLPMIMVAHATYPQITTDGLPASISSYWITTVLRKRIGYRGIVITDDMEMGGLLTQVSIEEAAVQTVLAGSQLLEICKDPALLFRAYEALLSEAESSPAFRRRIAAAARAVTEQKQQWLSALRPATPRTAQLKKLKQEIESFTARLSLPQARKESAR